ncbi:hypothetical protein ACU686_04685 [Yinghuangia aomiensis]
MTFLSRRRAGDRGAIAPEPRPGDRRAMVAAYAAVLAIAVIDALVDPAIPGAVSLGLIALAAAGVRSRRQVAGLAVVSTLTAALLVTWCESTTVTSKFIHVTVVASLGLVALGVTSTRLRREAQLRHARSVAMTLQSAVLEPVPRGCRGSIWRACTWRRRPRRWSAATSTRWWTGRTASGCS